MVLGIDISHHSGQIDWKGLAKVGIKFAFLKSSEGSTFVDHLFESNWEGMHQAQIPCGAYHFARPGTDPGTQAAHFYSVVGDLKPTDLQPVLDLEVGDGLAPAQVMDWALEFVAKAESLFRTRLIIYTGGYWRNQLGNPSCPTLGERKLWIARYGGTPILPQPWRKWSIWQFSDGVHSAPPEAKALKLNCDWNQLADDLTLQNLTVASNPVGQPNLPALSQGRWPGRFFVYPAKPLISGEDVREWQKRMCERGWALAKDGFYGAQSKAACMSLQRQVGLVPDGIVGPKTWEVTFAT
jgi:lysozyme